LRWWRSFLLFLLLERSTLLDSPFPSFAVTFHLLKTLVLSQVVANTTLPSDRGYLQDEVWILPLNGPVNLW